MSDKLTFDTQPRFTSTMRRDALVVRLIVALTLSVGLIVTALLLASVLGVFQPNCDGMPLNNRVGGCYVDASVPPTPQPTYVSPVGLDTRLR